MSYNHPIIGLWPWTPARERAENIDMINGTFIAICRGDGWMDRPGD